MILLSTSPPYPLPPSITMPINPNWTPEQVTLFRQTAAIVFANLPVEMPLEQALDRAIARAAALVTNPILFPQPDPNLE